jgi:hypothetical protein
LIRMTRWAKVRDEVLKTGFPLEVNIIDLLLSKGWIVEPSVNFFDDDEHKFRELDIRATKHYGSANVGPMPNMKYNLSITLVIECKKSEKDAWVFFPLQTPIELSIEHIDFLEVIKKQTNSYSDPLAIRYHRTVGLEQSLIQEPPLISKKTAVQIRWLSETQLFGVPHFSTLINAEVSATGVPVRIGKSDKIRNTLYTAAMTTTKALTYYKELLSRVLFNTWRALKMGHQFDAEGLGPFSICLFIPVIIFDGALGVWRRKDTPQDVDRITYHFVSRSPKYLKSSTICVIHKDHIPEFLDTIERDMTLTKDRLVAQKGHLDTQTNLVLKG